MAMWFEGRPLRIHEGRKIMLLRMKHFWCQPWAWGWKRTDLL